MSSYESTRSLKGNSLLSFPNSYVVIDLETTGFSVICDSIIEVAAIKVVDRKVVDSFQELVNPGFKVDSFVEEFTGITNEMLVDARSIEQVLLSYLDFIGEDSIIVGHNVNFDINFIYDERMSLEGKPVSNNFVDTLRLSRQLLPSLSHHRLGDLIEYYDIKSETQHRALADCLTTHEALKHLEETAIQEYETVENFLSKNQNKSRYNRHRVDLRTLKSTNENFDESHPLFQKHCCFTGTLGKYTRTQAAQIVVNFGGVCDNGVTKKTNFLILGNDDYCNAIKDGKSAKYKKAESLILKGEDLIILSESDFYEMIETEVD